MIIARWLFMPNNPPKYCSHSGYHCH